MKESIRLMQDPLLSVEIISPTKEDRKNYFKSTGELELPKEDQNSPREFQKATIKITFDEDKYPVGSVWMIGETPGMKVSFFGEKIVIIQERDLKGRIG